MNEPLPPRAVRRLLEDARAIERDAVDSRYRLVRELGRGGMGVVYEAEDLVLERRVALKMLPDGEESAELRARFAREAQAAARLAHPHIAQVHDATPRWIAMQLIHGRPLAETAREESRRPEGMRRIVTLVRDAARAVHHAHGHGVIHRDLKPSNLLVAGDHVWVVDFGLAKQAGADASVSTSGSILGTPAYMAPEQAAGRLDDVDARTDVYGLGATLYAALAGRPPFEGRDVVAVLKDVIERDPPPPWVERDLDVILGKCLAKEPAARYASAAALADDLDRWLEGRPILARPPSVAYRVRKLVSRHRALLKAAALAGGAAVVLTALALLPVMVRERAQKEGAAAALELSTRVLAALADAEALRRVASLGEANRRLDAEIRGCEEFLARHEIARVHQLRGRLLRARGRPDAARAAFDRALALEPALAGARFERGLLVADEDVEQALADLAVEPGPDSGLREIDLELGRAERARLRGDLGEARRRLEQVRLVDPMHLGAAHALTRVALAEGDDERALEYAINAVNLTRPYGGGSDSMAPSAPAVTPAPSAPSRE